MYLPLEVADSCSHHIVRVPPQAAVVLNSKDKVGLYKCLILVPVSNVYASICLCVSLQFLYIFTFCLQAPYIIYVEVVEVDHLEASLVQPKLSHSLRHTRSEENLLHSPAASTCSSTLDLTAPSAAPTVPTSGLGSSSSIPSSLSSPHITTGTYHTDLDIGPDYEGH